VTPGARGPNPFHAGPVVPSSCVVRGVAVRRDGDRTIPGFWYRSAFGPRSLLANVGPEWPFIRVVVRRDRARRTSRTCLMELGRSATENFRLSTDVHGDGVMSTTTCFLGGTDDFARVVTKPMTNGRVDGVFRRKGYNNDGMGTSTTYYLQVSTTFLRERVGRKRPELWKNDS